MIVWHTTAGTFVGEDQQAILAQFGPNAWYEPDPHLGPEAVGRIVTNQSAGSRLRLSLSRTGPPRPLRTSPRCWTRPNR